MSDADALRTRLEALAAEAATVPKTGAVAPLYGSPEAYEAATAPWDD